jgi:hypothetical protein
MLSRATNRTNIKVLGELRPRDFVPVNEEAFARWGDPPPEELAASDVTEPSDAPNPTRSDESASDS